MALDIVLASPVYNTTGKYGSSLSGGTGQISNFLSSVATSGIFTLECWVKTTDTSGSTMMALGQSSSAWIAMSSNKAAYSYGPSFVDSGITINDGVWHHLAMVVNATTTGAKFYVDGVLRSTVTTTTTISTGNPMGVRCFTSATTNPWVGEVDEIALWSDAHYSANFTPAAISNSATNLVAVYHLDGNGINSMGVTVTATAITMTGPSSGLTNTASTSFSVGVSPAGGSFTGTVVFTPSDSSAGGTFSPTSISLTTASSTGLFTYTPPATAATITIAGTSGTPATLSSPSSLSYTSTAPVTVSGAPTSVVGAITSTTTASVSFSAPTSNGGSAITGYTATSSPGGLVGTVSGSTPSAITISGLSASTAYTFTVTATNGVGTSAASAASTSVSTPSPSATTSTAPTGIYANAGYTSANITFSIPTSNGGSTIISYTATSSPGGLTGTVTAAASGATSAAASGLVTVSGLLSGTSYTFTLTATNAIGVSSATSATNSMVISAANSLIPANILFSPYNWNIIGNTAKSINSGAYFKFNFAGGSCLLQFDMTGVLTPLPKVMYRVDNLDGWNTLDLASNITISTPSEESGYSNHYVEFYIRGTTSTQTRWSPQSTAVVLLAIILDSGKVISKPTSLPLNAIYYGDSITEGVQAIAGTGDLTISANAVQGWAYVSAQLLGAEVGIVGFGGQGWGIGGSVNTVFPSTYNYLYSGVARSFTVSPDFIVINQGTNDSTTDNTAAITTTLNGLLAATSSTTKIFVLRPFNGTNQSTFLQNGIAACTKPSRCVFVDTNGFYNGVTGLHPNGFDSLQIAPFVANVIRPYVQPLKGTRSSRTVTLNLVDTSNNPRASLTGLKWAFYDQITPDIMGVAADNGSGATTTSAGVFSISVNTTLATNGVGWLVISDSTGSISQSPVAKAFGGVVTVV